MTWWHPFFFAISTFSLDPTVPITSHPKALAHWHNIWPTPPAAAWNKTLSPFFTAYDLCNKYSDVMPFNKTHEAISSEIPSGYGN